MCSPGFCGKSWALAWHPGEVTCLKRYFSDSRNAAVIQDCLQEGTVNLCLFVAWWIVGRMTVPLGWLSGMAEVACHLSWDSAWAFFLRMARFLAWDCSCPVLQLCCLYCFSSAVFLTWIFWPALEPTDSQGSKWMHPLKQYRYLKDLLSCACKYLNVRIHSANIIHEWQTENSISYRENDTFFS